MASQGFQQRFAVALAGAGICLDGDQPWDIRVQDERFFDAVRRAGLVGLGDAYVAGWWTCHAPDQLFDRALANDLPRHFARHPVSLTRYVRETLVNHQSLRYAADNVHRHYDLGNDLFEATLDPYMTYSCAYWREAADLDRAQVAKLDRVCQKLGLRAGMRVLDIGCGWGSFVRFASERYGCRVVGITPSAEQVAYAREKCEGLPVEVRQVDYREIDERFDRVVSIGMFEHVGPKNYRRFMRTVHRCLKADGLCLLHFFATQRSWPNLRDTEVLWVTRHIFPGLVVPSLGQVGRGLDGLLVTEDLENFGADYDPTLMAWHANFDRNWPRLRGAGYDERFYRMWTYYLLSCAGAFRSRKYQLWQLVLAKAGVRGGYRRPDAAPTPITGRDTSDLWLDRGPPRMAHRD